MNMKFLRQSIAAFSVIELILTLAIGLLLSSSFTQIAKNNYLFNSARTSAEQIRSLLDYYSAVALTSKQPQRIVFSTTAHSVSLQSDSSDMDKQQLLLKLPRGVEFSDISFGTLSENNKILTLRPQTSAIPGRVTISSERNSCTLTQSLRGLRTVKCLH